MENIYFIINNIGEDLFREEYNLEIKDFTTVLLLVLLEFMAGDVKAVFVELLGFRILSSRGMVLLLL